VPVAVGTFPSRGGGSRRGYPRSKPPFPPQPLAPERRNVLKLGKSEANLFLKPVFCAKITS